MFPLSSWANFPDVIKVTRRGSHNVDNEVLKTEWLMKVYFLSQGEP